MRPPFWELPPQVLDKKGRCCGRKPSPYKREGMRACLRCSRHYHLTENRMVSSWAYHANGHQRLRHPQGGGASTYREGSDRYFFCHGLTFPVAIRTLVSRTYRGSLPSDPPGELASWAEATLVVFTFGAVRENHMGCQFHVGQATIKFGRRYRK